MGSRWDTQRAHLESSPSRDGLRAMVRAIARGSTIVRSRRLRGGLGSATHLVSLRRPSGRTHDIILKRYREFDDGPAREWARTVHAHTLAVPTPEPVAFDADGAWFGAPSIVIGRVTGRPFLTFAGDQRAYEQIAETILVIASASTRNLPADLRKEPIGLEYKPPEDLRRTPLSDRAVVAARRLHKNAITQELVMSHGDLHPGNMLWSRGHLTGLVDWGSSNLAFRTRDVVYCRTELAVLFGLREADRFLDTYERVAGDTLEHVRAWDLMQGINALCWVTWWAYAYREQGRTDLTDAMAKRRAAAFVRRALTSSS